MSNLLFYILSTGVCLSLFVLAYQIFLRNNTRFNLCRFYLISAILLSFLIPSTPIDLGISQIYRPALKVTQLEIDPIVITSTTQGLITNTPLERNIFQNIDYLYLVSILLLSISLLLLIRFIYRFGSIILIQTSGNRLENSEGLNLIFTDKTDNAFSFLGYIFINPLKFNDEEKRLIIDHEREHIRHFHSIDLILIELLIVLQWFNPFAYIARRKLIEIHEFIADNGVIRKGADPYSYQSLLLSVVTSSCLPSAGNQLSAFITKKRIAMIGKPMNQTGRWINFLILIPIAAILIIGISAFSPKKPIIKLVNTTEQPNAISNLSELEKRAEREMKDANFLKDFYFNIPSKENTGLSPEKYNNRYSVILKKDCAYEFFYYSGNKDDKLAARIESDKSEVSIIETDFYFSYSAKRTFIPKQTGAYHLSMVNLTSKSAEVLTVLSLKNLSANVIAETSTRKNIKSSKEELLANTDKKRSDLNLQIKKEEAQQKPDSAEVFLIVEQMPSFGSGKEDEFKTWVASNLKYPKVAAENGTQGTVYVQFVIDTTGRVTNVKIERSVDPVLDKEALRIVQSSPNWKPGKQRGKAVRVSYTVPVSFTLKEPKTVTITNPVQSQETSNSDSPALNVMLANAMKDIENTYLKDFKMSLAPNTTQKFSLILKKDITYVLYLYSSNKEDNLVAQIGSKLPDESTVIEKELSFSSKGRITFTPNRTGAYHLMMENLSSKNATALMLLTLKEINNSVENDVSTLPEDEIFTVVEQMPSFGKGNPEEFRTWVTSNMQYPKEAAEKGIQGKVYVQFIVTKDGSLKSPKVIKSVNPLLDAEALRVVSLSPKWNPGMQRGAAVNVQYAFPITFTLK